MSYLLSTEIPCQSCKLPNTVEVWSIINVKEDPELKDLLLGGEINMAECQACRKIFYAEHFVLYHDPDIELMAFVYPFDDRTNKDLFEKKTTEDFNQLQKETADDKKLAYAPITLFGLDELVRLIEWQEEADIQSEIVAALSHENGLHTKMLAPAQARRLELPRILPFANGSTAPTRDAFLKGLSNIRELNENLSVYLKAQEILKTLPLSEIERVR